MKTDDGKQGNNHHACHKVQDRRGSRVMEDLRIGHENIYPHQSQVGMSTGYGGKIRRQSFFTSMAGCSELIYLRGFLTGRRLFGSPKHSLITDDW
jgi:hypothetical protein